MKITGSSLSAIKKAALDIGLLFSYQKIKDNSLYGKLKSTKQEYLVDKNKNVITNKPCAHALMNFSAHLLTSNPGALIEVDHINLNKASVSLIQNKYKKKGFYCAHLETFIPIKTPDVIKKPPKSKTPGYIPLEAPPIEGIILSDGLPFDTVRQAETVSVFRTVSDLYAMHELLTVLPYTPLARIKTIKSSGANVKSLQRQRSDYISNNENPTIIEHIESVGRFLVSFERSFARNLFDYLVLAASGEARHCSAIKPIDKSSMHTNRGAAWKYFSKFDPRTTIPILERIFKELRWNGGFGGRPWWVIANAGRYFYKFYKNPIVFIDHVIDLSHHGGFCFNKGLILEPPPADKYQNFLDTKRAGSILWNRKFPLFIRSPVAKLIDKTVALGLSKPVTCKFALSKYEPTNLHAPFLNWGNEPLQLQVYQHAIQKGKEKKAKGTETYLAEDEGRIQYRWDE